MSETLELSRAEAIVQKLVELASPPLTVEYIDEHGAVVRTGTWSFDAHGSTFRAIPGDAETAGVSAVFKARGVPIFTVDKPDQDLAIGPLFGSVVIGV